MSLLKANQIAIMLYVVKEKYCKGKKDTVFSGLVFQKLLGIFRF